MMIATEQIDNSQDWERRQSHAPPARCGSGPPKASHRGRRGPKTVDNPPCQNV